jgi:GT2 family glycosyltransferase
MSLPSLSIVIPSHNGRANLERCLPSVRQYAPSGTQVIVVDDASTDGTPAWLAHEHPWVEVLSLKSNQGFCAAVNAGLARARGEVVELLNDDTEVAPGWADFALKHFADPAVGSVAPLVLVMDQPDRIDSAGIEYHLCGWARNRHYGQAVRAEHLQAGEVFGASGSSGLYRRSALGRAGGLSPEYGAYFEDVDLAFRLRWAGYRCVYEPASRVWHKGSATYGRQPERLVRLLSRNEELVFWINLPVSRLALGLLPHVGFLAVRLLRRTLAGQFLPYLAGKAAMLRLWPLVRRRRLELRKLARGTGVEVVLPIHVGPQVLGQGWRWIRRRCA